MLRAKWTERYKIHCIFKHKTTMLCSWTILMCQSTIITFYVDIIFLDLDNDILKDFELWCWNLVGEKMQFTTSLGPKEFIIILRYLPLINNKDTKTCYHRCLSCLFPFLSPSIGNCFYKSSLVLLQAFVVTPSQESE